MSRVGKTPISLPKGVELKSEDGKIIAKGPKGTLETLIPSGITLKVEGDAAIIKLDEKSGLTTAKHGLYRSLVANAVEGVSTGFTKKLTLIGVGFRAALKGADLELALGFSHPCSIKIPEGLKVDIEKNVAITITGTDKALVGQFAATVRRMKKPEPYKGKGVRYENEVVRKKAGKAAKGK